jgi:hypothetical protein
VRPELDLWVALTPGGCQIGHVEHTCRLSCLRPYALRALSPAECQIGYVVGLCTLNQVDPYPITYNLSNP